MKDLTPELLSNLFDSLLSYHECIQIRVAMSLTYPDRHDLIEETLKGGFLKRKWRYGVSGEFMLVARYKDDAPLCLPTPHLHIEL